MLKMNGVCLKDFYPPKMYTESSPSKTAEAERREERSLAPGFFASRISPLDAPHTSVIVNTNVAETNILSLVFMLNELK
jgi:hypothetical protein